MENLQCECGETVFWWFGYFLRCPVCLNEYKDTCFKVRKGVQIRELWVRRFNKETKTYDKNWEHYLPT